MRKTIPILLTLASLAAAPLGAVSVKEDALANKRLFGIEMPEGLQSFYGRHDRINSVSLQEYQAGPYKVTEVVIDMSSSPLQLRLYHTEVPSVNEARAAVGGAVPSQMTTVPNSVERVANKGRDKANATNPPVVKDYPLTTHAKTIEFRISSKEEVEAFYRAFVGVFTGNKATGATDETDDEASARDLAGTLFLIQ